MTSTIKNVFFLIMFAVIAAIMYLIFFGWNTKVTDTTYETDGNSYIGVLGHMSVAIEDSISSYYNEYVFLPTVKTSNSLAVTYLGVSDTSDTVDLSSTFGLYTTSSSPAVNGNVKAVYTSFYNGATDNKLNYE